MLQVRRFQQFSLRPSAYPYVDPFPPKVTQEPAEGCGSFPPFHHHTKLRVDPNQALYHLFAFLSSKMALMVMSSRLCKKLEGAVFPVEIEPLEDRVNNSVYALHVDKTDHGPGSPPHFYKAAFDDVGGPQLTPQMLRKVEEAQQLRQIAL